MHWSKPDARGINVTLAVMASQAPIESLTGTPRLAPYLRVAGGDVERATELYLWANDLAGALHSTIAHVEIGVRNAINPRLSMWNELQGGRYGLEWALQGQTAPLLYDILGAKKLNFARKSATEESYRRPKTHPRHRATVTNDDVVAQLMFGSWVKVIHPISGSQSRQKQLWAERLCDAFPGASSDDAGRQQLGRQLERVRRLRNRVAHHDNLLGVEVEHRLNDMLAILRAVDSDLPAVAMARNRIRTVLRSDPRN